MLGSTVKHKRSLNFYLDNGRGGYIIIDEANYPAILAGPTWVLDEGLSIVEEDFSLSPAEVSWTQFDTKYTAQGVKLTVEVEVMVSEDAEPGWYAIKLKLPGLMNFSNSKERHLCSGVHSSQGISEGITIAGVTVHETGAARNLAVLKNIGIFVGIGAIVVGGILLFLFLSSWSRR